MNCATFHERLLDLTRGRLQPGESEAMLAHAAGCADCEAVLSVEEQLEADRRATAAEHVPDEMVSGMWPAVRARISSPGRRISSVRPAHRRVLLRTTVTGVAAALLVASGYLLGRVGIDAIRPEPRRAETGVTAVPAGTGDDLATEILAALDRIPDERTLLSAEEVEIVLRHSPRLRSWALQTRAAADLTDGLQAREVRTLLSGESGAIPVDLDSRYVRRWLRQRV